MTVTNKLTMDIARRGITPHIDAVQNDAGTRAIALTLTENGESYAVPDGVSAAVAYRKPDGTAGLYDTLPDGTAAVRIEGGTVTATLAAQALTCPGTVRLAIVLTDGSLSRLGSFPVHICVAPDPAAGAKKSENYYNFQTIDQINAALDSLTAFESAAFAALMESTAVAFDSVEEGKVYSLNTPAGAALAGYNTFVKAVNPGEVCYITTALVPVSGYAVAVLYGDSGFVAARGLYQNVGASVTDYEVAIPENVTKLLITTAAANTPILTTRAVTASNIPARLTALEKSANRRNYVSFADGECRIKAKYNGAYDLLLKIAPGGGNGLPDIRYAHLVANTGALSSDITVAKTLVSNYTDFIAPHCVGAVNDPDGDAPDKSGYLTGGNHRTTNLGTGGGVTARTGGISVYCDSVSVDGEAWGDEVTVCWTNYIQGYNTSRSDGTGREILREDVTLTVRGCEVAVDIRHTALEDVVRTVYYGLQMLSSAYGNLRYIGGRNRALNRSGDSSNCGGLTCREMELTDGAGNTLTMTLDGTDLGDFSRSELGYSAFNIGGKCYFAPLYGVKFPQKAGEVTTVRGAYRFHGR